jgi:sugar lactone lactonase YvrE
VLDRIEELAGDLNHPEGVAWDPVGERVIAGGEDGELYAVSLDGEVEVLAVSGGSMLGVAVDGLGRVYACDDGHGEVVRFDPRSGELATYAHAPDGAELDTPNMLAFDDEGALYVTCSGEDDPGAAGIVRVAPGGEVEWWSRDVRAYPNGLCVTADGEALLVIESRRPGLVRVPIRSDGSAGTPETLAPLPDSEPDGVTLDERGSAYVTRYRPDGIVKVAPDGTTDVVADDPLAHVFDAPTNLAFVGASLDRAVVANVGDRFLSIADLDVRGLPLRFPEPP